MPAATKMTYKSPAHSNRRLAPATTGLHFREVGGRSTLFIDGVQEFYSRNITLIVCGLIVVKAKLSTGGDFHRSKSRFWEARAAIAIGARSHPRGSGGSSTSASKLYRGSRARRAQHKSYQYRGIGSRSFSETRRTPKADSLSLAKSRPNLLDPTTPGSASEAALTELVNRQGGDLGKRADVPRISRLRFWPASTVVPFQLQPVYSLLPLGSPNSLT